MTLIKRLPALIVTALVLAATAGLSLLPYGSDPEDAIIRLSWRARGELVEACRKLTAEELAALPVHMRREEVCEGRIAPYHLTVSIGGHLVDDATVRPAGARGDRPVFVFREYRVPPGTHLLDIAFYLEPDAAGVAAAEPLELQGAVHVQAGDIALVTLHPAGHGLVVRGAQSFTLNR